MNITDQQFTLYVKHVLKWEGLTSKDPDDTAIACAPFKGAYHTNRGVTFCTFKKLAANLGIIPVTYERFLALTNDDIKKFVFHFCEDANADKLPTLVCLSVTEAAWGSGPNKAIKQLQQALVNLGQNIEVDGSFGTNTRNAVLKVDPAVLYREFWKVRISFIESLLKQDKFKKWRNGWRNRIASFFELFGKP